MNTLRTWQQMPPQMVDVVSIKTDPVLQPRNDKLVRYADQHRVAKVSEDHVTRLHVALQGGKDVQLEPLLVASFDGCLYLVDGHHRLKSYRRAKRHAVPVRILQCTRADAVMLSKLVNAEGTKLPMTREQAAEACWQIVAEITARGAKESGMSYREIAGLFGVSKDTVGAMCRRVQEVKLTEFAAPALDPGTGWPMWKYVKQSIYRPQIEITDPDQRRLLQTEKDAAALAAFRDKQGLERFHAALALLLKQAADTDDKDCWEGLRKWSEMEEPVEY